MAGIALTVVGAIFFFLGFLADNPEFMQLKGLLLIAIGWMTYLQQEVLDALYEDNSETYSFDATDAGDEDTKQ